MAVALVAAVAAVVPPAAAALAAAVPQVSVGPVPMPAALPAQPPEQPYADQVVQRLTSSDPVASASLAGQVAVALHGGADPLAQAVAVARSSIGAAPLVRQAYEHLLGRDPDPAGGAAWADAVGRGLWFEGLVGAVASSAEFAAVHPSAAERVDAVFQTLLGRAADPAGGAYWSAALAGGVSPAGLVAAVSASPEYGFRVADAAYEQVLQRAADPGGRVYWQGRVSAGTIGRIDLSALLAASPELQLSGCDPLVGRTCMLPWPNDYFTVADPTTTTGRRLSLKPSFVPANASGTPISPVQVNRSDGFSPGSTLMLQVPGIDLAKTGAATVDRIDLSTATDAPIVIVDTDTNTRVPWWAELDQHAPYPDPADQLLLVHPARNLADGHHYVVAMRHLKDASGTEIPAPSVFAAYRDQLADPTPGFDARKPAMEATFTQLATAGVARGDLYLAWDFTVASTPNLTGRMLRIRDDAFASLGSAAPSFSVTSVTAGTHTGIARVVDGTFTVPNYLTGDGSPGSTFNEDASGVPVRNGTLTAPFRCVVPTSALTTPARASLYGHGLFGSNTEVTAGNVQDMAAEHNMVFCATKWLGMADEDVPTAAFVLTDLSGFAKLADRVQQGVLDTLFLGRLMIATGGLTSDAAFQNGGAASVIDTSSLFYDGNSQGGILGGMATAVATDWTRAVLGVSGMNYSLLLPRSSDFTTFETVMTPAYPSELSRVLGLALVQLEWDRAEPSGYANHLTSDPLPNTPVHKVLMQIAFGDHQVSNIAADTEARTIGASTNCPSLAPGRSPGFLTLWNVPCIAAFPFSGSAITYWDSGSDPPPLADVPPPGGPGVPGHDPHSDPRSSATARSQKSDFLQVGGSVTNPCGASPCTAG